MSGRKNILITVGFVLSISLISSALTAMMMFHYDSRLQFNLLNTVCGEVLEQDPQAEKIISAALKEYRRECRRNGPKGCLIRMGIPNC